MGNSAASPSSYRNAQQAFEQPTTPLAKFANSKVICEGWYPVCHSRELKLGTIKRIWIGSWDIALYRNLKGTLHAVERACPHLGTDLTNGRVVEKGIQCAFHCWCWDENGLCVAGGGVPERRRIRTYIVQERWGVVWIWAGKTPPSYELPKPDPLNERHILRLPSQRIDCHPHVMLGNGLDFTHVAPTHKFQLLKDPIVNLMPPHRLSVKIHGRFGPTFMRKALLLNGVSAEWEFTTVGPSLAWLKVLSPTPFELIWAGRPLADGSTATQTVIFLPGRFSILRALPMMIATTWADKKVLHGLRFRQGFVSSDAVFHMYAKLIDGLAEWNPEVA